MAKRIYLLKKDGFMVNCPNCGQNRKFVVRSEQVAEDCCEVWVKCPCGYNPTEGDSGDRIEDVWGMVGPEIAVSALTNTWNMPITAKL